MGKTTLLGWRRGCGFAACAVASLIALPLHGQSQVVSIEEHWELKVADPETERSAPQTTMVMSPTGDLEGLHFLFTLNHSNAVSYEAGGMHVQLWDESDLLSETVGEPQGVLSHHGEKLTWVQRIDLEDGELIFRIVEGNSETWGDFGGGDDLRIKAPTSLANLNAYRPAVSINESQVGYAENRVQSLVLMKLIWRTDDGQVFQHNAPIPIDTSLDP